MIFIAADIPRYIGQGIGMHFGLSYWASLGVGLIMMIASMLGYFAIRRKVFSD